MINRPFTSAARRRPLRALALSFILAATGTGEAIAQSKAPAPLALPLEETEGVPANWRVKPTSADVERAYPFLAATLSLSGYVIIACNAEVSGDLSGCRIESETPLGLGFGKAALGLAPLMKMYPKTVEGRPVESEVKVPLVFKNAVTPAPPRLAAAPSGPPPSAPAMALAKEVLHLTGGALRTQEAWDSWLNRRSAEALTDSQPQAAGEAVAALRKALEMSMSEAENPQARILVSRLSMQELTQTAAFLTAPAGKAFVSAIFEGTPQGDALDPSQMYARARQIFCATNACGSF